MKRSKFGNKKVTYQGIKFDSKRECKRYQELVLMQKSGEIKDLELQPEFILQESFRNQFFGVNKNGSFSKGGKIKYISDFKYFDVKHNLTIVEDVKSAFSRKDSTYRLKAKLFVGMYPEYYFREVL